MKKLILIITCIFLLTSCVNSSQEKVQSSNSEIEIEKLFEVDGCTIYRFMDGQYRYFTNCKGSVSWREGKNNSQYMENQTN